MDICSLYRSKITTPEEAAERIASGSKLAIGMAMAEPPALLNALANRAAAGGVDALRAYYYESTSILTDTILRYDVVDRIHSYCMFVTAAERAVIKRAAADDGRKVVNYVPSNFHEAPRLMTEEIGIDVLLIVVSPMDKHGYFSLGTGNDYSSKVARTAKLVIVEVNENMPRVSGTGADLHISEIDAIVEHHVPLLELPTRPAAQEDAAIGHIISALVPDGACLQMGVGALPNLVCSELKAHKDLGIHTEALNPGLVDLIKSGAVTNSRKALNTGKTIFTFALGQKWMYEYMDGNPSIESQPVDYTNDPRVIAQNDNVVSINATLQIDLTGACNSEYMLGHQYSATGGQLDFVRGAYASKGGKSIITARSTAAKGAVSRIVARLDGPVTTPRTDTHIVVTEFGWANLKGKSSPERARALIELAHPDFRDALTASARELHLI
jgi:itaconate CoA-transferase